MLFIKTIKFPLVFLLLCHANPSQSLSFATTYPVKISPKEYSHLDNIACKKHQTHISTYHVYTYQQKSKNYSAYVECLDMKADPQKGFYVEHCDKEDGVWSCDSYGIRYIVKINNRNIDLILDNVPMEIAYPTLQKISNSGFQGQSIDNVIGDGCQVSYIDDEKQELKYNCGWESTIGVSLFCPTDSCPRVLWIH